MRERVLIIDDERFIAQALTLRLEAAGYDVHWASDGASGIAAVVEWRPGVIVLDIRMPDMDGFEVNRRLRARPELSSIPVIFLSANVQESARQAALAAGAHAFLTKPYESKDILTAIRSALDLNTRTANPPPKGTIMSNKRTILVIDNDEDLTLALTTRLRAVGFNCLSAASGPQGLKAFLGTRVDLIVSDLSMPGGDGVALAEAVRRTSDVPIIIITGFRDDFKRRLRHIRNVSTLRKPFQTQELIDLVTATIGEAAPAALPVGAAPEAHL